MFFEFVPPFYWLLLADSTSAFQIFTLDNFDANFSQPCAQALSSNVSACGNVVLSFGTPISAADVVNAYSGSDLTDMSTYRL